VFGTGREQFAGIGLLHMPVVPQRKSAIMFGFTNEQVRRA